MVAPRPPREKKTKETKPVRVKIDSGLRLQQVQPLTEAQRLVMFGSQQGHHIIAVGSAGSGKTHIATYLALNKLFGREIEKVVIVRSAVATRDIGALPGDVSQKIEVYSVPYKTTVNTLCQNGTAWDSLVSKGAIEFISTSYIRGVTLDNCVVIVDECQNLNTHEMFSILSRAGENCQFFICGDTRQSDFNPRKETSCYDWLIRTAEKMPNWFEVIHHYPTDIVRSEFCKQLIIATEE